MKPMHLLWLVVILLVGYFIGARYPHTVPVVGV